MVVNKMNPAVKNAALEIKNLLHKMNTDNLDVTFQRIDQIRLSLANEKEELEVVSTLITLGEL